LTGLPNRVLLLERLQAELGASDRDETPLALLLIDLDRFKEVNDTFGHHYGDLLLRQIGPRLQQVLSEEELIARLGGDEFAVVLPGANSESAVRIARKLLAALEQPFPLNSYSVAAGASIGIGLFPEHGTDSETLLQHADVAMYVAKSTGSGWAVYVPEQDRHSPDRVALATELREAIEQDELRLHFQPQVSLATGRTVSVEALVRWQHPQRGLIPPDEFIPLAESAGLIRPLSRWVLNAALRNYSSWAKAGVVVPVAINLSMRDLHDPELPDTVARLLTTWRVPPKNVTIEITESSLMDDPTRALQIIASLSAMGLRIAIDDFGTGYSSLTYLKHLPVDELKIDRSFVQHMTADPRDAAILRATIGLAHDLNLQVIAEGVEDLSTWNLLTRLGCDNAQGYLVSRPQPSAALLQWLHEQQHGGQFGELAA
jgi:diguanylate cyclase (GGDEF)-like protein